MANIEVGVHSVAVCYPTESLSRQLALWAFKHEDCQIEPVFGRLPLDIRRSLDGADFVLVDASDDHAQAIDLFAQSVARLGLAASRFIRRKCTTVWRFCADTRGMAPAGSAEQRTMGGFFPSMLPAGPEPVYARQPRRRVHKKSQEITSDEGDLEKTPGVGRGRSLCLMRSGGAGIAAAEEEAAEFIDSARRRAVENRGNSYRHATERRPSPFAMWA